MNTTKLLKLLYVQVLIGLALGIAVGHYWPEFGAALKPLGDGFVKLVKMMIAPIVFCTIVSGITSLSDNREIGKTLLKAMGLFYSLTIFALLTGLAAVFLMQPGAGMHIDPKHLDAAVAAKYASQVAPRGFAEFVLHIIPSSFFGAFAEGEVLPVLLVSVLCGFGLTKIGRPDKPSSPPSTPSRTCSSPPSASSCGSRRWGRSARWPSRWAATASSRSARWVC